MGLLHFVQQDHTVGLAAHRLGEHAAFAITHVARGRANQLRDFVLFLEFGHVDDSEIGLAAIDLLGKRQCGLGLAHTTWAHQQEDAQGLFLIGQVGPGHADSLGDVVQGMILAFHPGLEVLVQFQNTGHFVGLHTTQGYAGPVRQHLGYQLTVHLPVHHGLLTIRQLGSQFVQLGTQVVIGLLAQLLAQFGSGSYQGLLGLPDLFQPVDLLFALLTTGGKLLQATTVVGTGAAFPGQDLVLQFQRRQIGACLLQQRGHTGLAHGHAGTAGIQQGHRLVRQLATGEKAHGEAHRAANSFVGDSDAVVLLQGGRQATKDLDGHIFRRLVHLHYLEAAGQGGVLFKELLVLGPGGGRDRAQLTAGQSRFEQVGGIVLPGLAAGTHHVMSLIDEQDHRVHRVLDLLDHTLEAVFELTLHTCAGLQQRQVERQQAGLLQCLGHGAIGNALGQPLHHGSLAHARLTGEDRVILATTGQDIDHLTDFVVPAQYRIQFAITGLAGEINGELSQVLFLAATCRAAWLRGLVACQLLPEVAPAGKQLLRVQTLQFTGVSSRQRRHGGVIQQGIQQGGATHGGLTEFNGGVQPALPQQVHQTWRQTGGGTAAGAEALQAFVQLIFQTLGAQPKVFQHGQQVLIP